ncbi:MAG: preprotein translocase subunit SecA, partial [Candidatus Paceibacteria bacterium]
IKEEGELLIDKERDTTGSFRIQHEFLRPVTRREAYLADITYGTNNEYGFDYLRDNLVYDLNQFSQRLEDEGGFNFAIVDEIDSILIDEARTPLIISAPFAESDQFYKTFAKIAADLKEGPDFNIDEKMRAVSITQEGITKVEKMLGIENLYTEKGIKFVHHLEQALRAKALFHRDKDYVVKENEVIIVDEFTGRLMPG